MKKMFTVWLLLCSICPTLVYAQTPSCSVDMSELNFGVYNPVEPHDKIVSKDFKFICTKNLNYSYRLNNTGFLAAERDKLYYKIMLGDSVNNGVITANGHDQMIKMSAMIKAGQFVAPGTYTDNITFELIY